MNAMIRSERKRRTISFRTPEVEMSSMTWVGSALLTKCAYHRCQNPSPFILSGDRGVGKMTLLRNSVSMAGKTVEYMDFFVLPAIMQRQWIQMLRSSSILFAIRVDDTTNSFWTWWKSHAQDIRSTVCFLSHGYHKDLIKYGYYTIELPHVNEKQWAQVFAQAVNSGLFQLDHWKGQSVIPSCPPDGDVRQALLQAVVTSPSNESKSSAKDRVIHQPPWEMLRTIQHLWREDKVNVLEDYLESISPDVLFHSWDGYAWEEGPGQHLLERSDMEMLFPYDSEQQYVTLGERRRIFLQPIAPLWGIEWKYPTQALKVRWNQREKTRSEWIRRILRELPHMRDDDFFLRMVIGRFDSSCKQNTCAWLPAHRAAELCRTKKTKGNWDIAWKNLTSEWKRPLPR
jgi:hypothetical protein